MLKKTQNDDTQNYLVFQSIYKYLKRLLILRKLQPGNQKVCPMIVSNLSIVPTLNYINIKILVKFNGSCLKQKTLLSANKTVGLSVLSTK